MKNSSHAKTRGYSRRTRPAGTRATAATTTTTTTTTSNDSDNNDNIVSIPIPSTISTDWVMRTAPIVLARHLMYVRGLWPMSASQLFLLQSEGNSIRSGDGKHEETLFSTATNTATIDHDNMANKRRRVNITDTTKKTKINPSLRRKQRRASDQITRLCDEYICSLAPILNGLHQNQQHKLPLFLLISLGSSYGQSRELYLLDFQSLINNDNGKGNDNNETTTMTTNATTNKNGTSAVSFAPSTNTSDGSTDKVNHIINDTNCSHAKEQKLEATLTRKLLSALMIGEKSLTNSLPCKSSRTFRLFFTVGFKITNDIDEVVGATTDTIGNDDDDDENKYTVPYPFPDAASDHTAFLSSHTTSWIPRKGFVMPKQKHSRSSTRNQSLVTIRFHRQQRQQPRSRNEGDHDGARPSLVQPTSEKLTWMSLTTSVKGFGL
mmetsp:Transcript_3728/g.4393  ORF Transcript_3728/g.4393 Transcript_3728/m.4393 type:complete len:435 (-) Transcript_3728:632-1936(-)